jgi:membrane fusion protein (multidrug efflux system)
VRPSPVHTLSSLVILAFALLLWTGCGNDGGKGAGDGKASAAASGDASPSGGGGDAGEDSTGDKAGENGAEKKEAREKTTSVDAAAVVRGDLVLPIVAEGRIRARRSGEIRAEIAGRLDHLHVEEGQTIRKGQILATLDGREYEVAIDEARSRYLESLSRLVIEEDKVEPEAKDGDLEKKVADLWDQERRGKITREERLDRERALEINGLRSGAFRQDLVEARTGLAAARGDEERARLNLERTQIRAPFTGVVTGLDIQPGEQVTAGEVLCSLINNVDVEAEVGVLESDLRGLEIGRPALLAVPALGETLRAIVDVISPEIDADSRTCKVLLRYHSEQGRVRPGMFVRASIAGQTYSDRLLVPREAILTRDGRPLLFRVEGDRARWVYVTLGKQNDHVVEIARVLQGGPLEPGEQVVVSDHLTLTENAKIRVKRVRPVDDPWARAGAAG